MLQRFRDTIGRWVAIVIIALISIAFVFWGVDFTLTGSGYAARVNGEEISLNEFEQDFQNQLIQYQDLYGLELDEALRTEIRRNALDETIRTRALQQRVDSMGYRATDERVTNLIRATPVFQVDGQFSLDIYRAQLRFRGYSPAAYEELERKRLALLDLRNGIVDSTFLTPTEFRRYIELGEQRRQIGYALFEVASFLDQVDVSEEDVAAHYESNRGLYRSEEAVDLEYIELRAADIEADVEATEEELRSYYQRESRRFRTDEERRARHILVNVPAGGEDAALARAADILARIEAGEDFAEVAREISDDPGTRNQGGDLGWITEGMLEGPFQDTLAAMQLGEVRGPVRTDFGYHIIRLEDVRPGDVQPFEAVRDELREEYVRDRVDARFISLANELADRAFDAYDDLESVAQQMNLPLRTLEDYSRRGDPEAFPNNPPVVRAAFGREQLEEGLNSQLIELAPDHVLVLRVREHHPPVELPLEDVRERIEQELRQRRAEERAQAAASAFLAELGEDAEAVAEAEEAAQSAAAAPQDAAETAGGDVEEGEQVAQAEAQDAPADAEGDAERAADARDARTDAEGGEPDAAEAQNTQADAERTAEAADEEPAVEPLPEPEEATRAAALAEAHGGTWTGPRWVRRAESGVPSEVLSTAFGLPPPAEGAVLRERVFLASGDQGVLVLSGVRAGRPATVPQGERDQLQRELSEQAALVELAGYISTVREQADVRIPRDVLQEPDFF